jgi:hypothetical protein
MAKRRDDQSQAARPECGLSPASLELEIAKQNQELAEFRYLNDVRNGRAWEPDRRERRTSSK